MALSVSGAALLRHWPDAEEVNLSTEFLDRRKLPARHAFMMRPGSGKSLTFAYMLRRTQFVYKTIAASGLSFNEIHELAHLMVHADNTALRLLRPAMSEPDVSGPQRYEWLGPWEALYQFLERLTLLGQRADSSRQARSVLALTARISASPDEPPGHVVPSLRHPARGPNSSRMTPNPASVIREGTRAVA